MTLRSNHRHRRKTGVCQKGVVDENNDSFKGEDVKLNISVIFNLSSLLIVLPE
jgi:hypothetical protein